MITVNKLTKVYTGQDKKSLTALKNISFKLPDKGLIFITGKSGSGKSTLLNMLGGLDNITKGDIIADGNKFSQFKPADYDKYRNSYIGFIFQDYCLLEDLTVYQNIELVLDLGGKKDKDVIKRILDKVHLANHETRYPRELSGGQKQRVAIARAIAKDPQLILADEPTGNLDSKTAKSIMKILKELSKTKLVVVVSHNLEDAEEYGDRIIELADGMIIRDEQKMEGYEDKLELLNGKLILPHLKELTKDEISAMNKWQRKNEIYEFDQRQDGFYTSSNDITSDKVVETEKSKLSFGKSFKLAGTFLKRRRLSFVMTSLIVTCIVAVLGICQFFVNFDYGKAINDAVVNEGQNVVVGYKSTYLSEDYDLLNTSFIYGIDDSDIIDFNNSGYGDYYRLYNDALHVAGASQLLRQEIRLFNQTNLGNFYLLESYGTLCCKEKYLINQFGIDGQLKIYHHDPKEYGILITDYVADAMIYHSNGKYTSYKDLIGLFYENNTEYSHYISGIIETNYEEKYADFKVELMNEYATKVLAGKNTTIYESKIFADFTEYVEKYIGISYTTNYNYFNTTLNKDVKNFTRLDYSFMKGIGQDDSQYFAKMLGYLDVDNQYITEDLNEGEIAMSIHTYNSIFGTNYTKDNMTEYVGNSIVDISKFSRTGVNGNSPLIVSQLKVVKLYDANVYSIILDEEDFMDFRKHDTFMYALYFDDLENISKIYNVAKDNTFIIGSEAFNSVSTIIEVVKVFEEFFNIITIVLYCACLLLLVTFGAGNIRKRKFEIGVIKAMGGQTKEVGKIFIIQIVSIGLIVCMLSTLALYLLSGVVNNVLSDAMLYFVKNETLSKISIIQFNPLIVLGDILMILGITFLSTSIPIYTLHRIKPINIIKHKN